jgi:hypothetical protein
MIPLSLPSSRGVKWSWPEPRHSSVRHALWLSSWEHSSPTPKAGQHVTTLRAGIHVQRRFPSNIVFYVIFVIIPSSSLLSPAASEQRTKKRRGGRGGGHKSFEINTRPAHSLTHIHTSANAAGRVNREPFSCLKTHAQVVKGSEEVQWGGRGGGREQRSSLK